MPILPAILPRPFELRYKTLTSNFQPVFVCQCVKFMSKHFFRFTHIYTYIWEHNVLYRRTKRPSPPGKRIESQHALLFVESINV